MTDASLSEEEVAKLVMRAQAGDTEARHYVTLHFARAGAKIVRAHLRYDEDATIEDAEDIFQTCAETVLVCIDTYTSEATMSFSAYVNKRMRFEYWRAHFNSARRYDLAKQVFTEAVQSAQSYDQRNPDTLEAYCGAAVRRGDITEDEAVTFLMRAYGADGPAVSKELGIHRNTFWRRCAKVRRVLSSVVDISDFDLEYDDEDQ